MFIKVVYIVATNLQKDCCDEPSVHADRLCKVWLSHLRHWQTQHEFVCCIT